MNISRRAGFAHAITIMAGLGLAVCEVQDTAASSDFPSIDAAQPDDVAPELARRQWQDHVRTEAVRVRELAALRRLQPQAKPGISTAKDQHDLLSERVRSDATLERGDIIVTSRGMFKFKGQGGEERLESDFEAVDARAVTAR
jgi:hypothetical protein